MKSKGFTLVELIMTLTITGIVGVFVFQLFKAVTQESTKQDHISTLQRNLLQVRTALEKQLRMAGMNLENHAPVVIREGASVADSLTVLSIQPSQSAVLEMNENADAVVKVKNGNISPGGKLYLKDNGGSECHPVLSVVDLGANVLEVTLSTPLSKNFNKDSTTVRFVDSYSYFIDSTYPARPKLVRLKNSQLSTVAEGVSDLQVTYFDGSDNVTAIDSLVQKIQFTFKVEGKLTGELAAPFNATGNRSRENTVTVALRNRI